MTMTFYEFKCSQCGCLVETRTHAELLYYPHRPGGDQCESDHPGVCKGMLKRKFSLGGLQFIGPGFYTNEKDLKG